MTNQASTQGGQISIKIDGVDVASFSELQGISTQVDSKTAARRIMPHQLSHTVQQAARSKRVAMTVKSTQLGPVAGQRLRQSAGRKVTLQVADGAGRPAAAFRGTLQSAKLSKSQEWEIVYEGLQRVGG